MSSYQKEQLDTLNMVWRHLENSLHPEMLSKPRQRLLFPRGYHCVFRRCGGECTGIGGTRDQGPIEGADKTQYGLQMHLFERSRMYVANQAHHL